MSRIVKLPAGYRQVDYIESTGTQYVDTGFSAPLGFSVDCDIEMTSIANNYNMILGSHDTASPYYRNLLAVTNGGQWELGAYDVFYFGSASVGKRYVVDACTISGNMRCIVNGEAQDVDAGSNINPERSSRTIYLFGMNYTAGLYPAKMRLYGLKLYSDANKEVVVRDYIPCKTAENVAGLYDMVEGKFYGNAGTGAFLYGPPVKLPHGYRRVTHIQSSGTQYINSGVIGKSGVEVYARWAFTNVSGSFAVMGSVANGVRIYPANITNGLWGYGYSAYVEINHKLTANTAYSIYSKMYAGEQKFVVDGVTVATGTNSGSYNTGLSMFVFALNSAGSPISASSSRLYSMKIIESGTLVRDFVPCVTDAGEVGLYDDLNGVFYGNAGTGVFAAGDRYYDEDEITKLEYVESTGAQFVKTDVFPNQNTRVEMMAQITSTASENQWLFGSRTPVYGVYYYAGSIGCGFNSSYYNNAYAGYSGLLDIDYGKSGLTCNGKSYTFSASDFSSNVEMVLFARNDAGTIGTHASAQVYYCRVYAGAVIVRDYQPATSDGAVGLWDAYSGVLVTSASGTGLIAGPEVKTQPDTPTDFRVAEVVGGSVTLVWSTVEGAVGYHVYRNGNLIATQTENALTDVCAESGSYLYEVTAYNEAGESGAISVSVDVKICPDCPKEFFQIEHDGEVIALSWSATECDTYKLYRNGKQIAETTETSYIDETCDCDVVYRYALTAVNQGGESEPITTFARVAAGEPITPVLYMITDRTVMDFMRWLELRNKGYANMTEDERAEWDSGMKGAYNVGDLNRVGAAVQYVADRLVSYGYQVSVNPKTDWAEGDIPTQAEMLAYIDDIEKVKSVLKVANAPDLPQDGTRLNYDEANALEKVLQLTDWTIDRVVAGFARSASFMFVSGNRPIPTAKINLGRTWAELDALNTSWENWQVATWYLLLYGNLKAKGTVI